MQLFHLIWFLRGLAGLAIGFVIARKLRDFIRSIVIMCIPLKHRISERSFIIQTRITTFVGILLAIAIAIGLNWGLSKGLAQIGIAESTIIKEHTLTPTVKWPTQPAVPVMPTLPTPSTSKEKPLPTTPTIAPPKPSSSMPITESSTTSVIPKKEFPPASTVANNNYQPRYAPRPTNYSAPSTKSSNTYTIPYFAQIYAFRDFNKAQQQQLRWQQSGQLPVNIGFIGQEFAPYKVVIGPFQNRQAATYFLRQNRIKGFARPTHELQLFQ